MSAQNFDPLKQYIDDCNANLKKLTEEELSDDERQTLIYEMYANFLELKDECTAICKKFRKDYKVKDSIVKKWMADNGEDEEKTEEADD
jgi:hypothetical protein